MVMLAIGSALLGAVLGQRLKVLSLLPVALAGIFLIAVSAPLADLSLSRAVLAAIIFAVTLQLGYLGGLITLFAIAAARTTRPAAEHSTASRT